MMVIRAYVLYLNILWMLLKILTLIFFPAVSQWHPVVSNITLNWALTLPKFKGILPVYTISQCMHFLPVSFHRPSAWLSIDSEFEKVTTLSEAKRRFPVLWIALSLTPASYDFCLGCKTFEAAPKFTCSQNANKKGEINITCTVVAAWMFCVRRSGSK